VKGRRSVSEGERCAVETLAAMLLSYSTASVKKADESGESAPDSG